MNKISFPCAVDDEKYRESFLERTIIIDCEGQFLYPANRPKENEVSIYIRNTTLGTKRLYMYCVGLVFNYKFHDIIMKYDIDYSIMYRV